MPTRNSFAQAGFLNCCSPYQPIRQSGRKSAMNIVELNNISVPFFLFRHSHADAHDKVHLADVHHLFKTENIVQGIA